MLQSLANKFQIKDLYLMSLTQTLSDNPAVTWNVSLGYNAIVTLTSNRTVTNPSNIIPGFKYKLIINQDNIGSRYITSWGNYFKFYKNILPILSLTPNSQDSFEFFAESSTSLICTNFTQNIPLYSPKIIGGIDTSSKVSIQSTINNGASTNIGIEFLVGNNGNINALSILNNGYIGVGTSSPTNNLVIRGIIPTINIEVSGFTHNFSDTVYSRPNSALFNSFYSATNGGAIFGGISKSNIPSLTFFGVTNETTPTISPIQFITGKRNGADTTALSSSEKAISFLNAGPGWNSSRELLTILAGGNIGLGTTTPSYNISFDGSTAKTIGMERHPISGNAGKSLTINAGGAASGATDVSGGAIIMYPGISTGAATGVSYQLYTYDATTSGTANQLPTVKVSIDNTGNITNSVLSGANDRMVQANSSGTLQAGPEIISAFLTNYTAITILEDASSWDINGQFIGTPLVGTYYGQEYYNSDYYYKAMNDNLWIRMARV